MTDPAIRLNKVPCAICGNSSDNVIAAGYDFEYTTCARELSLRKCTGCGVIYLSPRPAISELGRIYPPQYNPFHFSNIKNPIVRFGRNFTQRKKVKALKMLLPEKASIMDAGCGSGALLMLLKKFGSGQWRLFGNDMDTGPAEHLKEEGIGIIPGRFEEIDTDLRFDLVILNQTIEHLDSPLEVLKKISGLLAPKGFLLIETPSIDGLDARLFQRRYWGGYHIPRHWTLFSSDSLSKILAAQEFNVIKTSYLASPSFWIQSVHHYFLDKRYPRWWIRFWTSKNPLLLSFFTLFDLLMILLKRPTSNMRILAQKP
ncbi:class I SAM-dependent methyltransferase [Omnitrophica bacterium]|nr:class I SAM-dependent methyltransferase [Candidatus Omnitrophota bacterium]